MLKEYIQNLLIQNEEEMQKLKSEMDELMNDIENQQQQMVILENEENADNNIFSPRSHGDEIHQKIANAQNTVKKLNQEVEHVREMIEALMKKKYEYESLMQEINERDEYFVQQKNENNEKKQKEDNKSKENRVSEEDNVNIEKEEESFQKILEKIYSKAEVCLAFLNDKNKCKAELRSMKQMIKEYISSFEKE